MKRKEYFKFKIFKKLIKICYLIELYFGFQKEREKEYVVKNNLSYGSRDFFLKCLIFTQVLP